ncbi:MAG: MotA/TolQ/ExbB proton channel family protein [Puniceicoccaceae bacterium]
MHLPRLNLLLLSLIGFAHFSSGQPFQQVHLSSKAKLDDALAELGALQESIAKEKIPLAKELNGLSSEVSELRAKVDRLERLRDSRDLNLSSLKAEIKSRQDEIDYARNLLIELINNQSSNADAAERQLYEEAFLTALSATDRPIGSPSDAVATIETLVGGVNVAFERIQSLIGGHRFGGKAVLPDGTFQEGTFILAGPVAMFASKDAKIAGITLQGSTGEPTLIALSDQFPSMVNAIAEGKGTIPLDPTLGKALALATTRDSLVEHIQKGGFWIFPILGIAAVSLLIAIFKFFELRSVKRIPKQKMIAILAAVEDQDLDKAREEARSLKGAAHDIVEAALKNFHHQRELIERSLEETLMRIQPKLERLISIVWITAATAPLLGLLGTVTGIITTFKLLTIFGSGDPKALGGGISEALITTEFGLIVAIPSLILHAFLSRKAKAIENEFEGDAMSLLNGIMRSKDKNRSAA